MRKRKTSLCDLSETASKVWQQLVFPSLVFLPPSLPPPQKGPACFNQRSRREIKLGAGPKASIWGQAGSCNLADPEAATKTINDFLNESLYFRNGLYNVYECEWQGAGRMLNHTDLLFLCHTPTTFSCSSVVRVTAVVSPGPKSLSLPNLRLPFVPLDSFFNLPFPPSSPLYPPLYFVTVYAK